MENAKKILILASCLLMAGCIPHFKEADSYGDLFRNDEIKQMPQTGDPYTYGGIAEGSGGTMARQTYATDNPSADFRDATETGRLGKIDSQRTTTPGNLPGTVGILPGTGPAVATSTIDTGVTARVGQGSGTPTPVR